MGLRVDPDTRCLWFAGVAALAIAAQRVAAAPLVQNAALAMYGGVVLGLDLSTHAQVAARRALEANEERLEEVVHLLEAANKSRSHLLEGIVTSGENERTWIAAELHDGPIQLLAAIGFGMDRAIRRLAKGQPIDAASTLETQREELTQVIGSLRRLMTELRPPALDEGGLVNALRDYTASFTQTSGIRCELQVDAALRRLDPKTETIMYRVVQEALTNVRKHARARGCGVVLDAVGDVILLEVRDDGIGFDPTAVHTFVDDRHFGLSAMRERIEVYGGTWTLSSEPGVGTTICAQVPAVPARVGIEVAS